MAIMLLNGGAEVNVESPRCRKTTPSRSWLRNEAQLIRVRNVANDIKDNVCVGIGLHLKDDFVTQ